MGDEEKSFLNQEEFLLEFRLSLNGSCLSSFDIWVVAEMDHLMGG